MHRHVTYSTSNTHEDKLIYCLLDAGNTWLWSVLSPPESLPFPSLYRRASPPPVTASLFIIHYYNEVFSRGLTQCTVYSVALRGRTHKCAAPVCPHLAHRRPPEYHTLCRGPPLSSPPQGSVPAIFSALCRGCNRRHTHASLQGSGNTNIHNSLNTTTHPHTPSHHRRPHPGRRIPVHEVTASLMIHTNIMTTLPRLLYYR